MYASSILRKNPASPYTHCGNQQAQGNTRLEFPPDSIDLGKDGSRCIHKASLCPRKIWIVRRTILSTRNLEDSALQRSQKSSTLV